MNVPLKFDVQLYGNMEQYDDSKSKCRVRIFYKGLNRNRTYISEEFANQLISSLPYAPIKGIFNEEENDFESHGDDYPDGRIYGIVMADPEFAWEEHLDSDGVTRTYACASILLYTSLYNEAKNIPTSSQSMEINPNTFSGEWKISEDDGEPFFYFTKGSLFGLQILGTSTEPCFEGAAFYNLNKEDLQNLYSLIYSMKEKGQKQESEKMDKNVHKQLTDILFRLSDSEKGEVIWRSLNPDDNEENDWKINYYICDIYDDYVIARDVETLEYVRIYYNKNDDDTITLGEKVTVKIVDVTESEYKALEAMRSVSESYEAYETQYNENLNKINELETANVSLNEQLTVAAEQATTYENTIKEKENELSEVNSNYEAIKAEKIELETQQNNLKDENEKLTSFKAQIENKQKEDFLLGFSKYLSDEDINLLKNKINDFSVEDFKKEVSYITIKNSPTAFEKNEQPDTFYKGGNDNSENKGILYGWEKIMNDYKNGGNK